MLRPDWGQISFPLSWLDEQTKAIEKLGSMGQE